MTHSPLFVALPSLYYTLFHIRRRGVASGNTDPSNTHCDSPTSQASVV